MPATDYFESLILNHALNQQSFSIQDWYVGLWTGNPTSSGSLSNEVTAADYERKSISFDGTFSNTAAVEWAAAVNDWGLITYVCLINSEPKGTGNMLVYQSRDQLDVNIGIGVNIPIGGLTVAVT